MIYDDNRNKDQAEVTEIIDELIWIVNMWNSEDNNS